ncbi:hypothetical protein [Natronosalvus halobius]|uniref:hypothetical protein n=1 Tax=Natronosalvus halobius TaxID=2953746 RepID=UPI0020A0F6D8|nr:hypothetical protein [Natronosalvus halobius]USZ73192.1 hypothetical protein NGM15_07805 [Natronosalvus halobius]
MSHRATRRAVERRLLDEHGAILDRLDACADAVADNWPAESVSASGAAVDPLQDALEAAGLLEAFPPLLVDLVESAGYTLPARPVPAPPYVVVTSRGPMLRATIHPGRLVVRLAVFGLERDRASRPAYHRLESVDVSVELR